MAFKTEVIVKTPSVKLVAFEELSPGSWFIFEGIVFVKVMGGISDSSFNSISVPYNRSGRDFNHNTKIQPVNVSITVTDFL